VANGARRGRSRACESLPALVICLVKGFHLRAGNLPAVRGKEKAYGSIP
jgi:hypothetical protein